MQPRVADAFVANLANVNGVGKQFVERSPEEQIPARSFAILCDPYFRLDSTAIQILHQEPDRPEFQVAPEDLSYRFGFCLISDETAINHVVADRHQTAHPHALLLGSDD